MAYRAIRFTVGIITAFIALTAIGGGVAIFTGVDQFPSEWLQGTSFASYTIPALLLSVVVGGSALAAAIMIFKDQPFCKPLSMAAGLIMAGYIVGEIILLKQTPPGPTFIEVFCLVLGLAVFRLAFYKPASPLSR